MSEDNATRRLIATTRQRYGGKWFNSGEEFEVDSEQDADDLVTLRFAVRATGAMGTRAGGYLRRDMKAKKLS